MQSFLLPRTFAWGKALKDFFFLIHKNSCSYATRNNRKFTLKKKSQIAIVTLRENSNYVVYEFIKILLGLPEAFVCLIV